jgi:hypothetical protein
MQVSLLKCEKSCIPNDSQVPKVMKNVYEVLRQKEMELTRLEKEVEALRLVAPLLSEEKEMNSDMVKPAGHCGERTAAAHSHSVAAGGGRRSRCARPVGTIQRSAGRRFSKNLLVLSTRGFGTVERRFSQPGILPGLLFWGGTIPQGLKPGILI